jgi:resuscitation-promoting factor RpfB
MSDAPASPAGWYPDPEQPGTQRYWDGNAWTDQRAPAAPAPPEDKGAGALVVAGYVTAVLLPIVGFVLGIVLLVRRQTAHGLAVFGISIAVAFVACSIALNDAEDELDSYGACIERADTLREMNLC